MIIDTEKLRNAIGKDFNSRGKKIDENVKDDRRAMAIFAKLEKEEMDIDEAITKVEKLSEKYKPV